MTCKNCTESKLDKLQVLSMIFPWNSFVQPLQFVLVKYFLNEIHVFIQSLKLWGSFWRTRCFPLSPGSRGIDDDIVAHNFCYLKRDLPFRIMFERRMTSAVEENHSSAEVDFLWYFQWSLCSFCWVLPFIFLYIQLVVLYNCLINL